MVSAGEEEVPREIEWRCHPARRRPRVAVILSLFLLVLFAGIHASFHDWFLTGLAMLIMLGSLSPFYFPTSYRMTEDSVFIRTVMGSREKSLDRYRRWQADRHGVLLSPFDKPSRLDRFHGLNLRFDSMDRERVLDFIRHRFDRNDLEG
jgi:hypothetical protein